MTPSDVQDRLRRALSAMIVQDLRLLTMRGAGGTVSERAVAFALGCHLRAVVDPEWDVDCDYNRAGHGSAAVVKRFSGHSPEALALRGTRSTENVTPDLVVHRRGETGPRNNLLVLELKTNDATQRHLGGSVDSVIEVVRAHGYQHGVFLDLRLGPRSPYGIDPRWRWISGAPDPRAASFAGVGLDIARLVEQGRREEERRYA